MDVIGYIRNWFHSVIIPEPTRKRRADYDESVNCKRRILNIPMDSYRKSYLSNKNETNIQSSIGNIIRPSRRSWTFSKENLEISDNEDDLNNIDNGFKSKKVFSNRLNEQRTQYKHEYGDDDDDDDDDDNDVVYVTSIEPSEVKAKRMGHKFFKSRLSDSPIYKRNQISTLLKPKQFKVKPIRPSYRSYRSSLNESYRLDDKLRFQKLLENCRSEWKNNSTIDNSSAFATPMSSCSFMQERSRGRKLVEAALKSQNNDSSSIPFVDLTDDLNSPQSDYHKSPFGFFENNVIHKSSPFLCSKPSTSKDKETSSSPLTVKDSSDSEVECISPKSDPNSRSEFKIPKINTMKTTLEMNRYANPDWIQQLASKHFTSIKEKKQKIEEEEKRKKLHSEHNKKIQEAALEERIRRSLLISDPIEIIDDYEEDSEPLPELTSQQEDMISRALNPNPPGQVLVQKFNMNITRRDIYTLAGLNWLNDEVINFYMNLIMERSKNEGKPKVYATNTFFYPKLMSGGQQSLRRWTKKVDIFAHHLMLVPIHLDVHWCMTIIDFRDKTIRYYDSMGGHNKRCVEALLRYLIDEMMDKKQKTFDTTGWTMPVAKNIPQQMNGSDCGMFSCTFAEFASRDAKFTFSQDDMPYLRRKMVYEIIHGKLLIN